ncbi:MAG: cupin domain-containing protein [Candidatus Polarisedimenticolia bacterium]
MEIRDPARKLGSVLSGLRLYRLAPGRQATRLHRHHLQEEMYLILKGSGTLRHANREVPVTTGDFILYRAGDPAPPHLPVRKRATRRTG